MLDASMLDTLKGIFQSLQGKYILSAEVPSDSYGKSLTELCQEVASTSDHIEFESKEAPTIRLRLIKDGMDTGVSFRAVPGGEEFNSLLLSILNADGKGKNLPDEGIQSRIRALKTPLKITTFASLTCTNCPDVVQSLNIMALMNDGIEHEMVDGALFREEAERLDINAVPSVFVNGELIHVGKSSIGELLSKLVEKVGLDETVDSQSSVASYDLAVIGGGPSGVAAAIYSARKGLNVAIVAERMGGQVNETVGIENIPSVLQTTGKELAASLKAHAASYQIEAFDGRTVTALEQMDKGFLLTTSLGESIEAAQVILATGAKWRKLGVKGEEEYIGKGVAFCPHCDGPFFQGKRLAVVGGGNSGIEAAIDLAGIASHVTVLEFMPELKADRVLQEKLRSLDNVEVFTNVATKEVLGDGHKVVGIEIKNRENEEARTIDLDGIFVQIGLAPNTAVFDGLIERNRAGEIVVDERCRTSHEGIYAAGDCTTVPYKQIVIAMGEGAKAALTAFDDRIRSSSM